MTFTKKDTLRASLAPVAVPVDLSPDALVAPGPQALLGLTGSKGREEYRSIQQVLTQAIRFNTTKPKIGHRSDSFIDMNLMTSGQ